MGWAKFCHPEGIKFCKVLSPFSQAFVQNRFLWRCHSLIFIPNCLAHFHVVGTWQHFPPQIKCRYFICSKELNFSVILVSKQAHLLFWIWKQQIFCRPLLNWQQKSNYTIFLAPVCAKMLREIEPILALLYFSLVFIWVTFLKTYFGDNKHAKKYHFQISFQNYYQQHHHLE